MAGHSDNIQVFPGGLSVLTRTFKEAVYWLRLTVGLRTSEGKVLESDEVSICLDYIMGTEGSANHP